MRRKIEKVAVLGAGVMGSAIAAHLANTRTRCLLLDIVPPNLTDEERTSKEKRNAFAQNGLTNALKAKPAAFYSPRYAEFIEVGNFDDDLARVGECDWIIEVVKEDLAIKQGLFKKLATLRKPGSIVTSNTSGLAIVAMTEGLPEEFRQNFMVTHFFNPVRYMKLLELVVGPETLPEVASFLADFGENVLGKGIVWGKDTPNFIANRIGVHAMMVCIDEMQKHGLTVEEVDAVMGPAMARPRSAAFRTADLVGLDTFVHVAMNTYDNAPNDEERDVFMPPAWLKGMVEKGLLGNKTKKGFYKKDFPEGKKTYYQIDPATLDYVLTTRPEFKSVKATKNIDEPGKRVRKVAYSDDKVGKFAWDVLARSLIYAANRLGEIADDIVNMDRAMRWGFNWDVGPFETWDAIGVRESVAKMEAQGLTVPKIVKKILDTPYGTFYIDVAGERYYYDFKKNCYRPIELPKTNIIIRDLKAKERVVAKNGSASIIDIGDDVILLEFHSKMNSIDIDIINMMWKAIELAEANYKGIVISNEGQHFSVGANLMLIWMSAQQKTWGPIEEMVKSFQDVNKAMRYCSVPVVAAPFQMALGGGCEVCLPADVIVANAELYMGLVEMGVGLIPGGGGTKEMVLRALAGVPTDVQTDRFQFIRKGFEAIGMVKVSFSADMAREIGYLRAHDVIQVYRDRLVYDAKQVVLGMSLAGYRPPMEPDYLLMPGRTGKAVLAAGLHQMKISEWITEYESKIGAKLAHVMCGGDVAEGTKVTEQQLLDLEREAFMSLCGEEKSQARMQHMLMKNKPLRN